MTNQRCEPRITALTCQALVEPVRRILRVASGTEAKQHGRLNMAGVHAALAVTLAAPSWLLVYFPSVGTPEYVSTHTTQWQCTRRARSIPTHYGSLRCLPGLEAGQ